MTVGLSPLGLLSSTHVGDSRPILSSWPPTLPIRQRTWKPKDLIVKLAAISLVLAICYDERAQRHMDIDSKDRLIQLHSKVVHPLSIQIRTLRMRHIRVLLYVALSLIA